MAQNPDFEVHGQVTLDNSDVKQVLDDTQAKAEKTAKETGTKISGAADDAAEKVKKKSQETRDKLASDTQKAGKQTEQTAKDTTEKVKKQFEAGSVAIGNIISGLVTKIASAGKDLIKQGISYNAQIQTYRTGLTNMLGDAEKANVALENIKQDAARTPFDTASLVSANQYLISAGENADYSRKTILALGDAVSATGGGSAELERMAQNLQQVANVGKASSVDIKQFAFAGINIYQVLADYTGKSIQDVQKMTISYDLLTKSLQAAAEEGGRYYNSMGTQSETFNGSLSTLKDNVSQLLGSVTEGLSSGLGEWMREANKAVVSLNETLQNDGARAFFESGASMIGEVIHGFADKIPDLVSKTSDVLSAILGYFTDHMDSIVQIGGTIIANLATSFVDNLPKVIDAAGKTLAAFIAKIIENLPNILSLGGDLIKKLCEGIGNAVSSAIDVANTIANSIASTIASVNWFELGASIIKEVGRGIYNGMQSVTEAILSLDGSGLSSNSGISKFRAGGGHFSGGAGRGEKTGLSSDNTGIDWNSILSSLTGGGDTGGSSKKTKSKAKKTAKVIDSLSETSHKTAGKITTDVQKVTEKYDDGTKKITTTTTQSEKKIIDGVEQTVKTVTTEVDDGSGKIEKTVKKTVDNIEQSVDVVEKKIKSANSEISSELSSGIFGILKSGLSDVKSKNWSGLALDVVKLIWGEVDQSQRLVISEWAKDVLKVINEQYASGGISSVISTIKTLIAGGELTTSGGTALASISKIVSDLTASGGMGEVLGTMATKLGSLFGTLATKIGSVGTALSGLATKLVAVVAANPEIFAILAIVAGIAALGAYIWKKHGKEISGWWGGLWEKKPTAVSADNYQQSDSITAARLVQESQAAAAANQQSTTRVQSGTGSAASQQLNASWRGSSTTILNLDGREVARSTAPYMDEELAFRS